jgi:hypothetical protein
MTKPILARDGFIKTQALTEGTVRKGGTNAATSQIQTRPPAPVPMKSPASPSTETGGNS